VPNKMLTAIAARKMIGGQGKLFGRAVTSFIAFLPQPDGCISVVHGPLQIAHFHKTFEALEGSRSLRRKDYHIAPTLCGPSTALGMILPRALRTAVGHELRDQQITSALASKGDLGAAGQYRREWDGPAALPPRRFSECVGGLSEQEHRHASHVHRSRSYYHRN
jgi:hypothetical protein